LLFFFYLRSFTETVCAELIKGAQEKKLGVCGPPVRLPSNSSPASKNKLPGTSSSVEGSSVFKSTPSKLNDTESAALGNNKREELTKAVSEAKRKLESVRK
jgi:hypothetical protein